ncbi:MAG: phenylalanine--tRNA ligase subunit beta [Candidatus Pacebacteria bacterium]|nr:phenylalanine--tRNA ligase subunit beta [Candidatus Paceibacterota bacterium]
MKISYAWLQTYFEKALPSAEKLAALFNAHSFEVESVEKLVDDTILDVKVLPDRAHYALCHCGVAGEASALTEIVLIKKPKNPLLLDQRVSHVPVEVKDEVFCRRYIARLIENVTVGDSPTWLCQRLESIGARSINLVVDLANFVMFDIGQPLHAFDADKISGAIQVRKASAGEKMVTLDGKEIILDENDLVIADDAGVLAIAGVKGGKRAEVTRGTTRIILEAANFNPSAIRRTSTRTNLRNDSSKRFENEITPALAGEAMDQITAMLSELVPEAQIGDTTDIYSQPAQKWTVSVTPEYISSVVGVEVSAAEIKNILTRLNCEVEEQKAGENNGVCILITPPLDRLDLVISADIAEEVARIKGYENLPAVLPPPLPSSGGTPVDRTFFYAEKTKNILVSLGFSEVLLYTLVSKGAFEISYPLASDKSALREEIAPKMAESLITNGRNADFLALDTVKLFEIGKVFPASGEKTSLCLGVLQIKKKKGVTSESVLKESLSELDQALGTSVAASAAIETGEYGARVEIDFDALVSVLSEKNGKNGSERLAELGFESLPSDKKYQPFSLYPFVVRDIAVFVPEGMSQDEPLKLIKKEVGELLVKDRLFDVFTKEGKTSYAYRLVFQSYGRTLTDVEIGAVMEKISLAMKTLGWVVR